MYPNPVKERITIKVSNNSRGFRATIYSILGVKIKSFTQNEHEKTYDFSNYKSGTYILKVETENGTSLHKILKI